MPTTSGFNTYVIFFKRHCPKVKVLQLIVSCNLKLPLERTNALLPFYFAVHSFKSILPHKEGRVKTELVDTVIVNDRFL